MNTLIDNNDYFNIYTLSKALSSYTQEELASELIKKKKQRDGLDFQITVNKECVTTIGCDSEEDFLKLYADFGSLDTYEYVHKFSGNSFVPFDIVIFSISLDLKHDSVK